MTSARRPNIVLIVLDSVRRDHLSCYGYERETTPNIDRIAQNGIRFTRASATSCWTLPSHASLFSGLYPSQHRIDLNGYGSEFAHCTMASYLKGLGYFTACISCNGFIPNNAILARGFDIAIDVERLLGNNRPSVARLVRGVHRRWRRWTRRDRGARAATKLALDCLARRTRDGPLFLFINYMDCHLPYRLRSNERYRFVGSGDRRRVDAVPHDPFAVMAGELTLSSQDLDDLKSLYDGCLYYLDRQVGTIDAHLRDLRLEDRTALVITSDHGESFGEHGLMDHQYGLYENLLAVPLILRVPGWHRTGESDERLVQHVDLFPTFLDLLSAGSTRLAGLSGYSLSRKPGREVSFAEYLGPRVEQLRRRFPDADISRYDDAIRSVRDSRHKLICHRNGGKKLYDLANDPEELQDLAEQRPDLVHQLHGRQIQMLGEWPSLTARSSEDDGMQALRDRLEALGYL